MRILIVDDTIEVLDLLTYVLGNQENKIFSTSTVNEAIIAMATWEPDLVLSDVDMKEGYRWEVLEAANALYDPPQLILMSGGFDELSHSRALKRGALAALDKPFELSRLFDLLSRCGEPGNE